MYRFIALAVACAAPAVLAAQTTASGSETAAAAPVAQPEKKICRREMATGSIMSTRICHTKAEWAAIEKADSHDMDNFEAGRRNGAHMGVPG